MVIEKVNLIHYKAIKEGTLKDGLPLPPREEMWVFEVFSDESDDPLYVQNDPTNRHYPEVAAWYKKKKVKPFKFKFE